MKLLSPNQPFSLRDAKSSQAVLDWLQALPPDDVGHRAAHVRQLHLGHPTIRVKSALSHEALAFEPSDHPHRGGMRDGQPRGYLPNRGHTVVRQIEQALQLRKGNPYPSDFLRKP